MSAYLIVAVVIVIIVIFTAGAMMYNGDCC